MTCVVAIIFTHIFRHGLKVEWIFWLRAIVELGATLCVHSNSTFFTTDSHSLVLKLEPNRDSLLFYSISMLKRRGKWVDRSDLFSLQFWQFTYGGRGVMETWKKKKERTNEKCQKLSDWRYLKDGAGDGGKVSLSWALGFFILSSNLVLLQNTSSDSKNLFH
jgi:hypothetical protein